MSKASKFIKNLLKSSSTMPTGAGGGPGFMMGSMFGGQDHEHSADGSCCGHDHHHHDHKHDHKHGHHHHHHDGDDEDSTNPKGGCC